MFLQSVVPNIISYNALISTCEKGKNLEKASRLFVEMQVAGIKPDATTYNALISVCEKSKNLEKALQFF